MIWGLVASKANREPVVKDLSVYFNKAQMYIQLAEIIHGYPPGRVLYFLCINMRLY